MNNMEPQMIDYYNQIPSIVSVIDSMNKELNDIQEKYSELYHLHMEYVRTHSEKTYCMPKIKLDSLEELRIYARKIYDSVEDFTTIIYDFLNHCGWILQYDVPNRRGMCLMGYSGCGYWDKWEDCILNWGDTTAQEFYYGELIHVNYNIYLRCKLLETLYNLFPEYKERGEGWFHKIINESFNTIEVTISTLLEYNNQLNQDELHDIIYRIIIEKLFGWGSDSNTDNLPGVFPLEYMNEDYIQNIIYYQCDKCKKIFHGEDAMDIKEGDEYITWFTEEGNLCSSPCICNFT